MKTAELLDLAKNQANIESDYALAKVLGISNGYVSEYRKGKRHPSNEIAVKLATLAKLDEMRVIAEVELQTANTEQKKEFWNQFLKTRGYAATLGTIGLGLALLSTTENTQASEILHKNNYQQLTQNCVHNKDVLYIMRKIKK